jgi:hypothetical protein
VLLLVSQSLSYHLLDGGFHVGEAYSVLHQLIRLSRAASKLPFLVLSPNRLVASFLVFAELLQRHLPALHRQWAAVGAFEVAAQPKQPDDASDDRTWGDRYALFAWWWCVTASLSVCLDLDRHHQSALMAHLVSV